MAEAVSEEYRSSLTDLNFNSKPHINMLTMLAEENVKYAPVIVDTILTHIKTVPPDLKLPSLYLVDSIMKNIGGQYITLFSKHMISLFSSVFEKVEETTRSALYKLRQTWNDILPKNILYGIDRTVNTIDPAWPITAMVTAPLSSAAAAASMNPIHVNPKFLGGPGPQCPTAVMNQEKPVATIRTELVTKDKDTEVLEMKKKQEEMLKLIEEKKNQLKALQLKAIEQKKSDTVTKQKKAPVLQTAPVPVVPHQHTQKKLVNHRDPRLKKSMGISQTSVDVKKVDKPGAVSLQSVVVVPNTRLPSDATLNSNGSVAATSAAKTKDAKPNALTNNAFPAREPPSNVHKGVKNVDKAPKDITKDEHNTRESLKRHCKVNKKHSTSPENKLGANAKKFCKHPAGKQKRLNEGNLELKKNESPPSKKQKNEFSKMKNNHSVSLHGSEERVPESVLFGTEDKDYRHQVRAEDMLQKRWPQPVNMHPPNPIKQEIFDLKDPNSTVLPVNVSEGNLYPQEKIVEHNPVLTKPCVETYIPPVIDNFIAGSHKPMDGRLVETKTFKLEENLDRNYTPKPIVTKERPPPPSTTSIVLDGKNRLIHFVNDRALTIMDNNEPKEVAFAGPPRNVFVEGMPHPLLLEFDGRQVEFSTEGKRNVLRFGTPSRELYINNYPYEAKFGGPHITATLEDQKEHKIRIDGPPPQVIISEKPAFELYEHFKRNNILQSAKNIKKEPEDAVLLQDVDMRVKPSHVQSTLLPECKKDVDWRHVASASDPSQVPWNVQKNSFETYNDAPGARNFPPGVSNIPSQLDFFPERNPNHATWPHPAYREIADRPPFEQLHLMDQKSKRISPNTTWDQMQPPSTLPPPPSIPLSLNLSTQGLSGPPPNMPQMPNLSIPPPSWNPLPPPPMFTGAVGDTLSLGSNSNPAPEPVVSLPSVPINVETIYEKLVAAGIIAKKTEEPKTSSAETANTDEKKEEVVPEEEDIVLPDIRLTPKSLRQFNPEVCALLYQGTQCATCGMRFKEIQSEHYSRHLDWHFRMNRREKDGAKKAYSRRWYYTFKDWIQFKEIEEAEERTPSYFELQADGELSKNEEKEIIQSVPASECESEKCSVCGEQFQLFWVEEEEEWHLKHAVRHEGEAYHPMCYEDHKKATELANREPEVPEEKLDDSVKEEADEPMSADDSTAEVKMEVTSEEGIEVEAAKEEKEDDSNKEQASPETVAESDKSEAPSTEPLVENQVEVSTQEDKDSTEEKVEAEIKPETSSVEPEPEEKEESETSSKVSVPKVKQTDLNSEGEQEDTPEEEFRPPTPDPRFKVLPAVFKGTELSALCTIM